MLKVTLSRLIAIQCIYNISVDDSCSLEDIDTIASNIIEESYKDQPIKADKKYVIKLTEAVMNSLDSIDKLLESNLDRGNKIDTLSVLIKSILRCGVCELMYFKVPYKVVIDEYVKLTKDFFSEGEVKFANAVLDNIAKKIEGKS